jgi:hypothetical protein
MGAPQIIIIALWVANFLFACILSGQPKKGTYNPFTSLLAIGINFAILWFGGFFVTMGTPQIITVILWIVDFVLTVALTGVPQKGTYNPIVTLISTGVTYWILSAGGFFH